MKGPEPPKKRRGRPLEYPDCRIHRQWREASLRYYYRRKAEIDKAIELVDSTPTDDALNVVEVSRQESEG